MGVKYISECSFPDMDCSEESGYCMTYQDFKFRKADRERQGKPPLTKDYHDWENEVAEPYLKSKGYKIVGRWYDGESDSFGPLSRCIRVEKDGKRFIFHYG